MSTSVDDISSYLSTSTSSTVTNPNAKLTYDDFLSLLSAELQNQDPTDPVDNKDLVLQLSQFSTLSEMGTLDKNFENFVSTSTISTLNSLIGRDLTYTKTNSDKTTTSVTGTCKGLNIATDGTISLNIDGTDVDTSAITSINQATTTSSSSSSSNASE